MALVSFDSETTGIDLYHGVKPFFVTSCSDAGDVVYWEWDVDPMTREPAIPAAELDAVRELLLSNDLVLQNAKFDARAVSTILPEVEWPWHRTDDTLLAGHLLASNLPHNLTDMAMQYLGIDIEPVELTLKAACVESRRLVRSKAFVERHGKWAIAEAGRPDMPSAKETVWKFDMWLPRAVALAEGYDDDHPWWTALRDYSNADSEVTVLLWKEMGKQIKRRKLWAIYKERCKAQRVAFDMEQNGVTLSGERLNIQRAEYQAESESAANVMRSIAAGYGFDLTVPKGGVNNSLREFVYDKLALTPIYAKKGTDGPTLNKEALAEYQQVLPPNSKARLFVKKLADKRKRDTALSYMDGYERFWLPLPGLVTGVGTEHETDWSRVHPHTADWYVLHPSLNQTGTDTLRWSSSNPNEQNISKKEGFNLRFMFGPPPGYEWFSLDARGIEDRLPAYKSGQQELIDIFERDNEPPFYGSNHLLRFSIVYPEIWEAELAQVGLDKVGPHCKKKYGASNYQWCKNGGFAVQYGAVEKSDGWGTADRAFNRQYSHRLLTQRLSKLEQYNQYWIKFAEKHGYVETMPDKTVDPERGYPVMCTRTEYGKIKPTVPLNYHIQSTAMWWTMKGMIRCQEQIDKWRRNGVRCRIVMQVHDEMVFEFPKSRVHPKTEEGNRFGRKSNLWCVRRLADLMRMGGDDIGVPTPVGVEYNEFNWAEGVTLVI